MTAAPSQVETYYRARRAVDRGVLIARVSAVTLLLLGLVSALFSVGNPWSASFAISGAVFVNGVIEWREAGRLRRLDGRAARRLSWNQLALGLEIVAYSVWQAATLSSAALEAVLQRPDLADLLAMLGTEEVEFLRESLLPMIRMLYAVVGFCALLGCVAAALFYRSRGRHVAIANAGETAARPEIVVPRP